MRQYNITSLVQIMACRLFGAKPLSEPMLPYCQLDPKEHISVKFCLKLRSFHSRKCTGKCRLPKGRPSCLGLYVLKAVLQTKEHQSGAHIEAGKKKSEIFVHDIFISCRP